MSENEMFRQLRAAGASLKQCMRDMDLTWHQTLKLRDLLEAEPPAPVFSGQVGMPALVADRAKVDGAWIVTSAQNNTKVHAGFWANLRAYAAYLGAEVLVAPFSYDRAGWEAHGGQTSKRGGRASKVMAWAPELAPFMVTTDTILAEGLHFCATLESNPTTVRPLSGLHGYAGGASVIFPHAKVALESVPVLPGEPRKRLYTTGACTLRNYIPRKTGLKAQFHHCYGALLVTVSGGVWRVRQINAGDDGSFYDLFSHVVDGKILAATVEAIAMEVHLAQVDDAALEQALDYVSTLQPRHIVLHDLLDFQSENHHQVKDALQVFGKMWKGRRSVSGELWHVRDFLHGLLKDWPNTTIHVVEANHNQALAKWLDEHDFRRDPVNAETFLELQLARYRAVRRDQPFHLLAHALGMADEPRVRFLTENSSLVLAGVQCGIHGHRGANGARGNTAGFARIGRKAMVGHTHTPTIHDGVYCIPTISKLDMGYNKGLSSWGQGIGLVYLNGKRALIEF